MEQIDIFNEDGLPLISEKASIDTVHQKGLWHQTFACWFIHPEKKEILIQWRGPKNRVDPGSFDASAGGHLASGEIPSDGFREAQEELGISSDLSHKFYLGVFRNQVRRASYVNNEFCHVYLVPLLFNIKDFVLQEEEVSGIFTLNIESGIRLFSKQQKEVWISGLAHTGIEYIPCHYKVTLSDFCAFRERTKNFNYYLKVLQNAYELIHKGSVCGFKNTIKDKKRVE